MKSGLNLRPELFSDSYTYGYYKHAEGRFHAFAVVAGFAHSWAEVGRRQPTHPYYKRLVAEVPELLMSARASFAAAGLVRDEQEVDFDLFVIKAITGDLEPQQISDLRKGSYFAGNVFANLRLEAVYQQLLLVFGDFPPHSAIADFESTAFRVVYDWESHYWYCRHLEVACAIACYRGTDCRAVLNSLYESYEELERLDRWEILNDALGALPSDPDIFSRKYAYLLSW